MEYKYIYDLVREMGLPNYLQVPSGLNIQVWCCLLVDYPDVKLVDHLEFGWPLGYTSLQIPTPTLINHSKEPSDRCHI